MQITHPTNPTSPRDTPLHQILLNTANLLWALSADPTDKDKLKSSIGEMSSIVILFPTFVHPKEAFFFPHVNTGSGTYSPREFIEKSLELPGERAQELADWIFQDLTDWSNNFDTGRRKGSFYKEKAIKESMLTLARMSPEDRPLGLMLNDLATVHSQKEFYAFLENARYTDEIGSAFTGVDFPDRIKERMLPMIEASALREIVQQSRAKIKAEMALETGFPESEIADESFAGLRAPKRL